MTDEEIMGAVARGFCHADCPREMDASLAIAIASEVSRAFGESIADHKRTIGPNRKVKDCSILLKLRNSASDPMLGDYAEVSKTLLIEAADYIEYLVASLKLPVSIKD